MKLFKKFSLIFLSTILFACSAFIFAGCGDDEDICKLYVFASVGGYVQVDDHEEKVEFGDEGSKIFTYKEDSNVTLKAIANEGYCFVKWSFTDDLADDYEHLVNQSQIEIKLDDDEVVVRAQFALDTSIVRHNVTYPTSTTGYLIVPESGYTSNVIEGSDFKFKVNLDEDYSNSTILVKANDDIITANNQGVYTISNITEDIAITVSGVELNEEEPVEPIIYAVFTQDTRLSIVPVGQDTCEVEEGSNFTFTIDIIDKTKYEFGDNVVVMASGEVLVGDNGKYTINSVTKNTVIVVEGIEAIVNTYTIVAENGAGVEIIPKSHTSCEVAEGEKFEFEIKAQEGYDFDSIIVTVNNELITDENGVYTIEFVTENIIVRVEGLYEVRSVFTNSALFTILPENQSTPNVKWTVKNGESLTFEIVVAEGYKLGDNVIVRADGMDLTSSEGKYTIYQVNNDLEITVEGIEEIDIYTISTNDTSFTIKPISHTSCNVIEGESFSFEIELNVGYEFLTTVKVFANGLELTGNNGSYTIDIVNDNMEISIEGIVTKTYTISTNENNYIINPVGQEGCVVSHGSNFTFEIQPKAGFELVGDVNVLANGTALVASNNQYTIENITSDIIIIVQGISLINCTISVPENVNYTITPILQQGFLVEYGSNFTFTVNANAGYVLGDNLVVSANGITLNEDNGEYAINNVTGDMEITVDGVEQLFSYKFGLDFAESIKNFAPDIVMDLGVTSVEFDIKESDKDKTNYSASNFKIIINETQETTIADLVDNINSALSNYSFNNISYFALAGMEFITINGDALTINWSVLDIANVEYDLIIYMSAN